MIEETHGGVSAKLMVDVYNGQVTMDAYDCALSNMVHRKPDIIMINNLIGVY